MQELVKESMAYRLFCRECAENRLGHAYMLVFNDKYALRDILKEFAKVVFRTKGEERIARLIDQESFLDCTVLPPPEGRYTADMVREIIEKSNSSSMEGGMQVFILDNAQTMSETVQNKLLKVLEEPPADVLFLLGATSEAPLLSTVLSRVKKWTLAPFTDEQTERYLLRQVPNLADARAIALSAEGRPGEALAVAKGGYYVSVLQGACECALALPSDIPAVVRKWGETKYKADLLNGLRLVFRDALCVRIAEKYGTKPSLMTGLPQIGALSERYSVHALTEAQTILADAEKRLALYAVFPQLLESVLCRIAACKEI